MPELPEVETVTRAIRPLLLKRTFKNASCLVERLRHPLDEEALNHCLAGQRIVDVRRRAKYIVIDLGKNTGLLLHLGMTGHLRICKSELPADKHDRVIFHLSRKEDLRLKDARRFSMAKPCTLDEDGIPHELAHLGPEPLGEKFTGEYLFKISRKRKRPIKSFIMDQAVVVGVGNIYASEALWRVGIRPGRAASRLTKGECESLVAAIREILREAIDFGGTTIINFAGANGEHGAFSERLAVYGRAGEPCLRCPHTTIKRIVQTGRSSFYCPNCQR